MMNPDPKRHMSSSLFYFADYEHTLEEGYEDGNVATWDHHVWTYVYNDQDFLPRHLELRISRERRS